MFVFMFVSVSILNENIFVGCESEGPKLSRCRWVIQTNSAYHEASVRREHERTELVTGHPTNGTVISFRVFIKLLVLSSIFNNTWHTTMFPFISFCFIHYNSFRSYCSPSTTRLMSYCILLFVYNCSTFVLPTAGACTNSCMVRPCCPFLVVIVIQQEDFQQKYVSLYSATWR